MVNLATGTWYDQAPIVDVTPNRRIWARRLTRTLTLSTAVARVWWPLLLPSLAGLVVAPWWVVAVGLVAAIGALGAGVPRVRSWLLGLPIATAEALFTWRWPRICSQASITAFADGAIRFPRLVEVELHGLPWKPSHGHVVIEPVAIQSEESWVRITSQLGRQLRFALATPVVRDALTLEVALRRNRLPALIQLGTDVAVSEVAARAGFVTFGESSLGGRICWELDHPSRTSILVAGGMGGGKSSLMNLVLAWAREQQAAGERVRALVINPKGTGDFAWSSSFATVIDCDPQTPGGAARAIEALDHLARDMGQRAAYLRERGLATWTELDPNERQAMGGRIVLILDEWVSFANMTVPAPGPPTTRGAPTTIDLMVTKGRAVLQTVTSQGRALGVNTVAGTQHAIAETLSGPYGSTMLGNFGAAIGCGAITPGSAKTLFGAGHSERIAALTRSKRPGRIYYAGLSDDETADGPVLGQAWYLPLTHARTLPPPRTQAVGLVDDVVVPFPHPEPDQDEVA